jgi:hypothetical protein
VEFTQLFAGILIFSDEGNISPLNSNPNSMKRLNPLLLLLIFFFYSCSDNDAITNHALSFDISVDELLPSPSGQLSLQLSLKDQNGYVLPASENIAIEKIGDKYVANHIPLLNGRYTVEDFLIVNENSEVIYAVPQKNSVLSGNVPMTVPFEITVSENIDSKLSIDVLQTQSKHAEDFGYAAARFAGKNPIHLAVYINENGKSKMTEATAYIQSSDGENYLYNLLAKVNILSFQGDLQKEYSLRVWKDGYQVYIKKFSYNQLRDELRGRPLEVVLEKDFSEPTLPITFQPTGERFSMWIEVSQQGMITLDWGNGEVESLMFNVDPDNMTATGYFYRDREYTGTAPAITLRGDIHLLTAMWIETPITSIDLQHATGLTGLSLYDSQLSSLNLSANNKLQWLGFYTSAVGQLTLPEDHAINTCDITSNGVWPSASQLDYIIDSIHTNAVADNITNGFMTLNVNEISDGAVEKLVELESTYGWYLTY